MAKTSHATRRTALSACLAAAVPIMATPAASSDNAPGVLRPTKSGRELIRRLPAYAEATKVRAHMEDREWIRADDTGAFIRNPEFDPHKLAVADDRLDEAFDRVTEIIEAIHERAAKAPLKHLIDVAIVLSVCSEDRIGPVEGGPQEVGALSEDGASMLARTLALALLRLAQIPISVRSVESLHQSRSGRELNQEAGNA